MDQHLEEQLAHALARHYSDDTEPNSLNEALGSLANACWTRAEETPDPYEDEIAARALIARALEFAARRSSERQREHIEARSVFQAGSFTMPRASKNPEQPRLCRTYRLMASCLWETWICDPAQRCADHCQHPSDCPTAAAATCARTEVFPYLQVVIRRTVDGEPGRLVRVPNWSATAQAIVNGLKSLEASGKLRYLPDPDAVHNALRRA